MQARTSVRDGLLAAAGLLLLPLAALAADSGNTLIPPAATLPDFLSRNPGETFQLPPVQAPPIAVPSSPTPGTIRFDQAVYKGNTVFSAAELDAVAAPYLGRSISASELEELRQKLTRYYVDRGYVNSGVVLAQDNSDNAIVAFEVIEGRLTGVRLSGLERLNNNYVVRRLVKESDGPLNLEILRERFQLLLGDPLFARMNGRLTPGVRPGEAYFDVDAVRAQPYQLSALVNNYRPPSIGSETFGLSGWVRNLTGQGDLLEASVQNSTEHSSGTRGNISWKMPLGYYGTQLSLAVDRGRSSVVEEPNNVLGIKSTLQSNEIGLQQSVFESLQHKLTVGLDRVNRENRTFLLGLPFSFNPGEPNGVTREHLWRLWQEYAYRSETSVLALRSTFTAGKSNLQVPAGLPGMNPKPQFNSWLGQAQYAHQLLGNGSQIVLRATLQQSPDRLLAIDGMSIGGVNTVRGFRENQLVRDVGVVYNVEFEYPLVKSPGKGFNATVIPFYDYGRGWNKGDTATTISSWGLANRIRWQGFSLDLVLAKRLVEPLLAKTNRSTLQDKGIHLQLSYAFF